MSSTALIIIATGGYIKYVDPLIDSARNFFVSHDVVLFSDTQQSVRGVENQIFCEYLGYPQQTLMRYHSITSQQNLLSGYKSLFYVDSDMLFVSPIKEDEIQPDVKGIVATLHPGYTDLIGTPERRPESKAYIPPTAESQYFCGGFIGGTTEAFLSMSQQIAAAVDEDTKNGIKAIWNDESHSNRFLYDNPPSKILDPSFCYPESEFKHPGGYYSAIWRMGGRNNVTPKLLALDKGPR